MDIRAAVLLSSSPFLLNSCAPRQAPQTSSGGRALFRVVLGASDTRPADWSGSVEVEGGRITTLAPWRFAKDDRLVEDSRSWKCATRFSPVLDPRLWWLGALHVVPKDMTPPPSAIVPNGLYVGVEDARAAVVKTAQGAFRFRPEEVGFGAARSFLDGRVMVDRVPTPRRLTTGDGMEDDYPAIGYSSESGPVTAWIGYRNQKEKLLVARADGIGRKTIAEGEFFRPALAGGPDGVMYLAVSVHDADTWKIGVASENGGGWSALTTISSGGPDLYARAVIDANGTLWVAWQGFRDGRSRILARRFDGKKWSQEMAVSENTRNAWEPALAADHRGGVHFAWDAFDDGAYNIYYRAWDGRSLAPQRQITHGIDFQAHASIACDRLNRPWIAWDNGGPNWGKDTGFLIPKGIATALYERRNLRVAVIEETGLVEPASMPSAGVSPTTQLPEPSFEQPQLVAADSGGIWCLARRRVPMFHEVWSQSLQKNRLQEQSLWDYAVLHYNGANWSLPVTLPFSMGRNDLRAAIAAAPDGSILAAWNGDGRTFASPYPFVKNEIYTGSIPALPYREPSLTPAPPQPATASMKPVHPQEAGQVARLRAARVAGGGRQLRVFRGDMHRHSDISFDGDIDGSVWDFYRYTIDAADFDYSALTDHNAGDDHEYFWWIIQKSNDLFHYPGRFVPVYAYERSVRYPNGHRNLLWAYRGVKTLPRSQAEDDGKEGAAKLYDYLRRTGGLAMPHTSATLMGTDWRDNAPDLDVLVEIYQGDRTSAEYDGAPRASTSKDPLTQPGGFAPKGFVWNAWAKGYKLGVQASSDHASTHVSYAMILAEEYSRQGLLNAMRARHAYAATDNILLDVRSGEHIQGDIFQTAGRPRIEVHIEGTAPVAKVEVIRNNKFVFTTQPNRESVQFVFEDRDAAPGESYYYVRLQQSDTQLAWSSPMWITYRP